MGATSSRAIVEYINEESQDKENYKYYSGERFCIIPNHFYSNTEEPEDGYTWYSWYWK